MGAKSVKSHGDGVAAGRGKNTATNERYNLVAESSHGYRVVSPVGFHLLKESIQAMALLIGSHMSIAGGYYRAVEAAGKLGMGTCQIFTKNNNQWRGKPILDPEIELFTAAVRAQGIVKPIAHTSYLINLASPDPDLRKKSIDALVDEWKRAEQLKLVGLVLHPGAATDGDESGGLKRIVEGVRLAHQTAAPTGVRLLFENTAGQGTALGWRIDQLASLLDALKRPPYLGICLDSCHAHAAGYDLAAKEGTDRLVDEFQKFDLIEHIHAIHLNDSKKEAGSRVDRHEHLGWGTLTQEGIRRFINHPAFRQLPMYLETEKGENDEGRDWDLVNMEFASRLYA